MVETLTAELRPGRLALNRAVDTYHCAPRARIGLPGRGPLPPDEPGLRRYLAARSARFWQTQDPAGDTVVASALYAGIDPVTCRHFGGVGDGWALVRLRLPTGLTFLDVRPVPGRPDPLSGAARRALAEIGCHAQTLDVLILGRTSLACRDVALRVLRNLGLAAILSDLPAFAFPGCPRAASGAFVLLLEAAPPVQVALFVQERPAPDPLAGERLFLRALYRIARSAGSSRTLPWAQIIDDVADDVVDDISNRDLQRLMKQQLFGCGKSPTISDS